MIKLYYNEEISCDCGIKSEGRAFIMGCVGIVAEYNPFHSGHKYHIDKSKEAARADSVVCVMSGNFVQRGGAAIADKWTRAKMAVVSGVDLVVELPCYFAMNAAEIFAQGAIATLDALGVADSICFGSECGDIERLSDIAYLLNHEPDELTKTIQGKLKDGEGYPSARASALAEICGVDADIVNSPNNILAIEYLRSLERLGSAMKPYTIGRYKAEYHSVTPAGEIASATAMRKMIYAGDSIERYMPKSALDVWNMAVSTGIAPVIQESFDTAVISKIRAMSNDELQNVNHMGEGLHNRIYNAAMKHCGIESVVNESVTKRYTAARISRAVWSAYLGIESAGYPQLPSYIRVLAMNDKGKKLLAAARKKATLPIITKLADYDVSGDRLMQLDIRSTDLYSMGYSNREKRVGGLDYTTSPIVL